MFACFTKSLMMQLRDRGSWIPSYCSHTYPHTSNTPEPTAQDPLTNRSVNSVDRYFYILVWPIKYTLTSLPQRVIHNSAACMFRFLRLDKISYCREQNFPFSCANITGEPLAKNIYFFAWVALEEASTPCASTLFVCFIFTDI